VSLLGDAGSLPSSADLRDVDRGVHNMSRTAMIAPMTTIAVAGFVNLAMSLAPNDGPRPTHYTRAVSPASRSAARSSVSCFLQNANRIVDFPRGLPAL
jgi:hypothetical protein